MRAVAVRKVPRIKQFSNRITHPSKSSLYHFQASQTMSAVEISEQTAAELINSPSRPTAPLRTESFRDSRPDIVGPDEPPAPFPVIMRGAVQKGFGRGGRDLGCLTANLPDESLDPMTTVAKHGIYFGYARVHFPEGKAPEQDMKVWPMVMSMGWNPYYKNVKFTAEVHIMHKYEEDFYGVEISVVVLGYIRPELDYTSREALIEDIETDKQVALKSLARPAYRVHASDI
ncbi:Riboflavin kinase [Ceratobasidium theobromae]|uniref:Riboflavin kinase n=1 Tax=Ceratobasidium theobromae TaxID=1582974 RepID=A0A5N5QNP1_9AGAM|nr:Riboflavin kinase [Ceratobasidium theobromae]